MRIKAQGDQAQRPQSYPGLPLPQPLCQEGQEIQWQGWARFRSMSLAPWWLSGGDLGVFMHTQPWKEDSPTLRMSQWSIKQLDVTRVVSGGVGLEPRSGCPQPLILPPYDLLQ